MKIKFASNTAKAKRNLRVYSISFKEAEQVFDDPFFITVDDLEGKGEVRYHAIGRLHNQTLVVVAFLDESDDAIYHFRIIMARKAEAFEEEIYVNQFR